MSELQDSQKEAPLDFIRSIVHEEVEAGKNDGRVHTRFPPEPNGYLHLGHAKSICLNFGVADEFGGLCNLRLDDTNPVAEKAEYADAIMEDVRWLGFDWEDRLCYASDYFDQLHEWALQLIKAGKAYVCDLSAEEMREKRGTLTEPGENCCFRERSVEENLGLFGKMRDGEFEDGSHTLRVKIDMSSPNLNMRDPVIYRIVHAAHPRTGDKWKIYPSYDFAHGQSDSIEGITRSLCTLEFEDHRPLYNWFCENLGIHHPRQIEFARLNLNYVVMSKRKMRRLVEEGHVSGWSDPRMPTIQGLRRRGYTPDSILNFSEKVGVAKRDNMIDVALLEHCLRNDLNKKALRRMGVLRPLKIVIENYPEDQVEELDAINNPEDQEAGSRKVPFSRELYIECEDFMEDPPKKFFRLGPGREVRLRYAYYITCNEVLKDDNGEVVELRCSYDPETKGGDSPDGRKVKGTLHWVSAAKALNAEVRLYDRLFSKENPEDGDDFTSNLNPDSLQTLSNCKLEPELARTESGLSFQLERLGYFCLDAEDSSPENLVLNRTTPLRDSWAKLQKKG